MKNGSRVLVDLCESEKLTGTFLYENGGWVQVHLDKPYYDGEWLTEIGVRPDDVELIDENNSFIQGDEVTVYLLGDHASRVFGTVLRSNSQVTLVKLYEPLYVKIWDLNVTEVETKNENIKKS